MEKFNHDLIYKITEKLYNERPVISRYKSENNFVFLLKFKNFERVIKIDKNNESMPWRILKEIYLIDKLKKYKEIPIPEIEFSDTSRTIIQNHWIIMKKMGDFDLNKDFLNKEDVKEEFIELGKILARTHKIKFPKQGFIFHDNIEGEGFNATIKREFNECTKKLKKENKISNEEIKISKKIISTAKSSKESVLCHNDFGPWQAVTKNKKITCIIDWELANSGDGVYDFAKAEIMMKIWSGNIKYFKEGYEEITRLPKDYEKIKIPYQVLETIKIMAFFIENKNNFSLSRKIFLELINVN
jgi:tRNA A-37 threonylcarbamoyl transferase component Bud32